MNQLDSAGWPTLGTRAPRELAPARLIAHWAAQIPAAVAATLADKQPDDSHTSLEWLSETGSLAGTTVRLSERRYRMALAIGGLELLLLADTGSVLARQPLTGMTLKEGLHWATSTLAQHSGAPGPELTLPAYDMPRHAVAKGAAFTLDSSASTELARWYAASARVLGKLARDTPGASAVRCWPHHFDIATLVSLEPGATGEDAPSIGIGMTPGDGSYPEPYFYVTPWPYPKDPTPEDLPSGGIWHRKGWFGAVLTGSTLIEGTDQEGRARGFIQAAIEAAKILISKQGSKS